MELTVPDAYLKSLCERRFEDIRLFHCFEAHLAADVRDSFGFIESRIGVRYVCGGSNLTGGMDMGEDRKFWLFARFAEIGDWYMTKTRVILRIQ